MDLLFTKQEIQCSDDFNAVLVPGQITSHGNDDFLVVIRNFSQGEQLPLSGFGGIHGFCQLNVLFLLGFGGDEVYLFVIQLAAATS